MRSAGARLSVSLSVGLAIGLLVAFVSTLAVDSAQARERTLKLYFGHTDERGVFTFKRNGRYDRSELERINEFLRDWRRDESARMDPELLDLIWAIYQETGSDDYIHIVSAYRSPQTNAALRSRSRGVARNSQHVRGKAIDFYIPGVPIAELRATAMRMQGGGVGYYPSSGSPFVHVDTGSVRAWPRMSRQQLLALFPNGETLHLPPDGKPLPGYEIAVARREAGGGATLAYLETDDEADTDRTGTGGGVRSWLARVLPGGRSGNQAENAAVPETDLAAPPATPFADEPIMADARPPRPRPATEAEIARAAGGNALPTPAGVAPADSDALATLAYAPLPRSRPDATFLAASLNAAEIGQLPYADDAIGQLMARQDNAAVDGAAGGDPIDLAFAALADAPELLSAEDSAVIAAFAAMRAAETGMVVAAATASEIAGAEPTGGVVLAPDELPGYRDDQDALRRLIATPTAYDPQFAQLSMPVPADGGSVYDVPEAAADVVADLSGEAQPPINRFTTAETGAATQEQSFFAKLFASLIE